MRFLLILVIVSSLLCSCNESESEFLKHYAYREYLAIKGVSDIQSLEEIEEDLDSYLTRTVIVECIYAVTTQDAWVYIDDGNFPEKSYMVRGRGRWAKFYSSDGRIILAPQYQLTDGEGKAIVFEFALKAHLN